MQSLHSQICEYVRMFFTIQGRWSGTSNKIVGQQWTSRAKEIFPLAIFDTSAINSSALVSTIAAFSCLMSLRLCLVARVCRLLLSDSQTRLVCIIFYLLSLGS